MPAKITVSMSAISYRIMLVFSLFFFSFSCLLFNIEPTRNTFFFSFEEDTGITISTAHITHYNDIKWNEWKYNLRNETKRKNGTENGVNFCANAKNEIQVSSWPFNNDNGITNRGSKTKLWIHITHSCGMCTSAFVCVFNIFFLIGLVS